MELISSLQSGLPARNRQSPGYQIPTSAYKKGDKLTAFADDRLSRNMNPAEMIATEKIRMEGCYNAFSDHSHLYEPRGSRRPG